MRGHGLYDCLRLADRAGQFEVGLRMKLAQLFEQQRYIAFQMTALGNEHRQHDDALKPIANQRFNTVAQSGGHEFKEGDLDAQIGCLSAYRRTNTPHRGGPLGIARTMRKEDKGCF